MYAQQDIQKGNSMGAAGIGIASGLINGAINIGLNSINNSEAEDRMYTQARLNYDYGELAAQNAFARQKGLIGQYFTPEAQLRQLKEAGLSPSQMYGGNGSVVGTSQSSAPQGSGAAGPSPLPVSPYSLDVATMTKAIADARLANAKADTEEGKNERGLAEIAKIWAEAGNIDASTTLTELDAKQKEIENYVLNATKNFQVDKYISDTETAWNLSIKTRAEADEEQLELLYKQETFDKRKEQLEKEIDLLNQKVLAEKEGIKLTQAETDNLKKRTSQLAEELNIKLRHVKTEEEGNRIKEEYNKNYLDMLKQQFGERIDLDKKTIVVRALTAAMQSAASAL